MKIKSVELEKINDGIYFLTGMYDEHTAELILTADGVLKNIVFVEEIIASAPNILNWKFTALKQPNDITNIEIRMGDYSFDSDNLSFYPNENPNFPDEVELIIIHHDYNEKDKTQITNGVYIFLDNYLGELNSITTIDYISVNSKENAENNLISITKLKDYLIWREKEFIEKYYGIRYETENDMYTNISATLENGMELIAFVNSTLLDWNSKASHPWILKIEIKYDGDKNNGFPDDLTYDKMNGFEDEIMIHLKDYEGFLNIGRETADSERNIYFACNDFRLPSKLIPNIEKKYVKYFSVAFEIYKDKYWQTFEKFKLN